MNYCETGTKTKKKTKSRNPFSDNYVAQEIEHYGPTEYEKDGIKVILTPVVGRN